nr:MAG TPA: hypothetical protein [Caudoviricetes sp.]
MKLHKIFFTNYFYIFLCVLIFIIIFKYIVS